MRANASPEGIALDLYDTPDLRKLDERDVLSVRNNLVSEDGMNWSYDRQRAQSAKIEGAHRIETAQHHLGKVGLDVTVHQ